MANARLGINVPRGNKMVNFYDTPRMPRFSSGDVVDVRISDAKLGDWDQGWDQGEILEVRNYKIGVVYKVKTFAGETVLAEERDLRLADK